MHLHGHLTGILMNYGNHIQAHTRKKLKNKKKRGEILLNF
jgi:hypothetical protein